MKKKLNKLLSLCLACFCVVSCFNLLSTTAHAAIRDQLDLTPGDEYDDKITFELNEDEKSYSVYASCFNSITEVNIPGLFNELPVTGVLGNAFKYNNTVKKINLPDSITNIEGASFLGCDLLEEVNLPRNLSHFGEGVFDNFYSLKKLTIGGDENGKGNTLVDERGETTGNGYFVRDGVLFVNTNRYVTNQLTIKNINHNALVVYPSGRLDKTYVVPNDTLTILGRAFSNPANLETVVVPASVQNFYFISFFVSNNWYSRPLSIVFQHDTYPTDISSGTIKISQPGSRVIVKSSAKEAFEEKYSHFVYNVVEGAVALEALDTSTTALSLNCNSLTLGIGERSKLEVAQSPFDTTDSLKYSSSNDSIVSFDEYGRGLIRAHRPGTATLTVTSGGVSVTCDVVVTTTVVDCEHLDTAVVNVIPENCESVGYTGDTACVYCGFVLEEGEEIPQRKHRFYDEWTVDVEPACDSVGYKSIHCRFCSAKTDIISIPAKGHNYGQWIIEKKPTCSETGIRYRRCLDCSDVLEEVIPATGNHLCTDWIVTEKPSCECEGTKTCGCTTCDIIYTEKIPATGHNYSEWVIEKKATCSEFGLRYRRCSECSDVLRETIPAKGHSNSNWIVDNKPTCTTSGYKHKECVVCGETTDSTVINATGHTSGAWITDVEASYTSSGSKHRECLTCGETLETVGIPQLKLSTPKVTTTNEIGGIRVTWNKIPGAVKYVVYRRTAGSSIWVNLGTTTGTSFFDKNVKSGTYYCYTVRAFNSTGGYSNYVKANTNTRKYMATPKLTTIYNHAYGLAIKWNAVPGITNGYRVYRRGAGSTYWTYLGTTKNLYFIDNAVKNRNGEYYRYTVIADGGYRSAFDANGLYLRRLANPTLNSAVSSKLGITVKWGKVAGSSGYYVYRKTANSTWTRIATVKGVNSVSYLDKTAKKGTTYTYTVRAVYGTTLSSYYSGISCKDKF